jgi:hypothetical protein
LRLPGPRASSVNPNFNADKEIIMKHAILVFAILVSGCVSTYRQQTVSAASTTLTPGSSVLIAVPQDATYGSERYPGSGNTVAAAVRSAFARYASKTDLAQNCDRMECMATASGYDYYVVPEILHWEDRATEWSGKRDKVELKVTVFDAQQSVVASQIIQGKSKWVTLGGDRPQDLLPEPLTAYVQSLYR